jgi:integrase
MSEFKPGSLGYQMMKALQGIFSPGASRHSAKQGSRDGVVITGIDTMRCMSADVHQFARFVRTKWPSVRRLEHVTTEMASAYIAELIQRERSGGRIGRVCASLRKLDTGCRKAGIFSPSAPLLLPYRAEGGPSGFHSEPRILAYTSEQADRLITSIETTDPLVARLLALMLATGLRVTEACYLRVKDIDLENELINLDLDGNANRTKGGRPRQVIFLSRYREFLTGLCQAGISNPTGHLFHDRRALAERARGRVRQACEQEGIPCLGTHGFRKTFAVEVYGCARAAGAEDLPALIETSHQLGHNRADVTSQSYVAPDLRHPQEKR